jgi:hypothetical protein
MNNGEILKQFYKRTKTGEMSGLSEIWPNFNHIDVESVDDNSDEGLTAEYGKYNLVVCADKTWYMQYAKGKWINGGGGSPTPPEPPTPTTETAYCGWAATQEEIDATTGTAVTINSNKFNTISGENYFMWFAIPATKNVSTVENTEFSGDFIQDDLVQLSNVIIDDVEYKVYCYEFIGLPGSNTYKVTLN